MSEAKQHQQEEKLLEFYKDKLILVTGGAGSIGSQITEQLLQYEPKTIRVLDNNETALFELQEKFDTLAIRAIVGDIRDKYRLKRAMEDIDIVFHAAALKHVPLCEKNPFEAVKTNVTGTQNLIDAALEENVHKVISISTDKAVNPINVMGATKLLSERITLAANLYKGLKRSIFSCVRFGNVLNSRGSVIPLFKKQIEDRKILLTDPNMTRFFMEIPHAVSLVLKAAQQTAGGEIFIFKMPTVRMGEFAEIMAELLTKENGLSRKNVEIKVIGKREGEKMHEELMFQEEMQYCTETKDMYIITPYKQQAPSDQIKKIYSSDHGEHLTGEELRALLKKFL